MVQSKIGRVFHFSVSLSFVLPISFTIAIQTPYCFQWYSCRNLSKKYVDILGNAHNRSRLLRRVWDLLSWFRSTPIIPNLKFEKKNASHDTPQTSNLPTMQVPPQHSLTKQALETDISTIYPIQRSGFSSYMENCGCFVSFFFSRIFLVFFKKPFVLFLQLYRI